MNVVVSRKVVNRINLKLFDVSKENEYNQIHSKLFDSIKVIWLLWAQVLMFVSIAVFKVWNTFAEPISQEEEEQNKVEAEDAKQQDEVAVEKDVVSSVYSIQLVSTLYMETVAIIILLVSIYAIKKTSIMKKDWVIRGVILSLSLVVNLNFILNPRNPIIHVQFVFVVMFTHHCKVKSFFYIMWITLVSMVLYVNHRISVLHEKETIHKSGFQIEWFFGAVAVACFLWTYRSYKDEIKTKHEFVTDFRAGKELQKLKSIINILVPSQVRKRVQDGKKNFSDLEQDVSIVVVDIVDFD